MSFQEKSIINVSEDKSRRRRKSPQLTDESDVNESFFSILHEQSRLHDATSAKSVYFTPQHHTKRSGETTSPGRSGYGTPMASRSRLDAVPAGKSIYGTPMNMTPQYYADYRRHFRPTATSSPQERSVQFTDSDAYKEFAHGAKKTSSRKQEESILEWFDRSMEAELEKRRPDSRYADFQNRSPGIAHSLILEATASVPEIQAGLRGEADTDLLDAADRLSKAEAMVSFEGAVRAAERAAANAPPELAEEAAVAGARGFQAELTSCIRQKIPGDKPIEVLGYVGITRPSTVKKPPK